MIAAEQFRPFARLKDRHFTDERLKNSRFEFSDLRNSSIETCDFDGSYARNSDFTSARVIDVSARNANLSRASFALTNLRSVRFACAVMQSAQFHRATIIGTDFSGAWLTGSDFTEATLEKVTFPTAQLQTASFNRTHIQSSSFSHAEMGDTLFDNAYVESTAFDEAILANAQLRFSRFDNCSFVAVNLSRANLYGTVFVKCTFSRAILRGAELIGSAFVQCDFSGTSLEDCRVQGSSFQGIRFQDTLFANASLGASVFGDSDLHDASGLSSVIHKTPSTIGVDSLYRSLNMIPPAFLAGAGLPDIFLTYLPELVMAKHSPLFLSCFISYSSRDRLFANRLHDELYKRGINAFLDIKDLAPGDFIRDSIHTGINQRDKVLLCVSRDALERSFWVEEEVTATLQREERIRRETGKKVSILIPLDIDGFLFDPNCAASVASQIKARVVADFQGWEGNPKLFNSKFAQVLKALKSRRVVPRMFERGSSPTEDTPSI